MAYTPINIVKFEGFNSSVASELLPDGMAREILNLRMEKVGKLVSRNGQVFGLFTDPALCDGVEWNMMMTNFDYDAAANVPFKQTHGFESNCGVIGIGEMILESKWQQLDSERMMVYAVRGLDMKPAVEGLHEHAYHYEGSEASEYRNRMMFLFAPITGKYKNKLIIAGDTPAVKPFIDTVDNRDVDAQGKRGSEEYLYTANRQVPGRDLSDMYTCYAETQYKTDFPEDHWINNYVQMKQYRHQLIISDRVNGDMLLEDEADRKGYNQCEENEHELHLRPNALASFDIDNVMLDARLMEGQENDEGEGITTGMALYGYELEEKYTEVTEDHFGNEISNMEWYPDEVDSSDGREAVYAKVDDYFSTGKEPKTLMNIWMNWTYEFASPQITHIDQKYLLNDTLNYRFTNSQTVQQYPDLLGTLKLPEEEYLNEDGEKTKTFAADFYKWDDFELKYFPSHGKSMDYGKFLTDFDRAFQKLAPGIPKITELKVKDNAGKYVPLGVWKYRYVWDYGDDIKSAPSAEVLCPDLIWSATKDDEIGDGESYDERPVIFRDKRKKYKIYNNYHGIYFDFGRQFIHKYPHNFYGYSGVSGVIGYPSLFQQGWNPGEPLLLTRFGEVFFNLKKKIYEDTNHRFAMKDFADISAVNSYIGDGDEYDQLLKLGELGVVLTVKYSGTSLPLNGWFWEGVLTSGGGIAGRREAMSTKLSGAPSKVKLVNAGGLKIPIFQDSNIPRTHNSLFDDEGRLRLSYRNEHRDYGYRDPYLLICLPGTNIGAGLYWWAKNPAASSPLYVDDTSIFVYGAPQIWGESNTYPASYGCQMLYHPYHTICPSEDDVYLNVISGIDDAQNSDKAGYFEIADGIFSSPPGWQATSNKLSWWRPNTILRAVKKEEDRLINYSKDLPEEASSRLILTGQAGIDIVNYGDKVYSRSEQGAFQCPGLGITEPYAPLIGHPEDYQSLQANNPDFGNNNPFLYALLDFTVSDDLLYDISVRHQTVATTPPSGTVYVESKEEVHDPISNLKVVIYGEGERLIAVEQLTSYFPSSLLFSAPRMGHKIQASDVPARAKKLLIYRTKSSHSNEYMPTDYGLVEEIEIERDENDNVITKMSTKDTQETGGIYPGIYYFDDVKDELLDFGQTPGEYEGLRTAIKSRFNTSLNEVAYYANYIETYQPISPRGQKYLPSWGVQNLSYQVLDSTDSTGYEETTHVKYKFVYEDVAGVLSEAKTMPLLSAMINVNGTGTIRKVVVLYYLPDIFDDYIKKLRIYRQTITGYVSTIDCSSSPNYPAADSGDVYLVNVSGEIGGQGGLDVAAGTYLQCNVDDSPSGSEAAVGDNWSIVEEYYYEIGSIEAGDEGIFVDNDITDGKKLICTSPSIKNYESGVRWSEPYRPDWIKGTSATQYASGDGKQITGVASCYGNLVIFKETSIHRQTVQAEDPPLSRVDEIDPNIGCIAPNTLLNIRGTLYFLSWQGFARYDNNIPELVDGAFNEELQFIMQSLKDAGKQDWIRDASAGYNPAYDEIWLNIPMLPTGNDDGMQLEYGVADMYETGKNYEDDLEHPKSDETGVFEDDGRHFKRPIYGHTYIINLSKGYATKFGNLPTVYHNEEWTYRKIVDPRQLIRLYYTNSYGEMRSADIFPAEWYAKRNNIDAVELDRTAWLWAGIYVETPYAISPDPPFIDYDPMLDGFKLNSLNGQPPMDSDQWNSRLKQSPLFDFGTAANSFPSAYTLKSPFKSIFKSKFFTGDSETISKRVRKVIANIFSRGAMILRSVSVPTEMENPVYADERITWTESNIEPGILNPTEDRKNRSGIFERLQNLSAETFVYKPSVNTIHPLTRTQLYGRGTDRAEFIPGHPFRDMLNGTGKLDTEEDWYRKPLRYSVEVESELRTQINAMVIYWKPIHTYLG